MIVGFGCALLCIALLQFAHLGRNGHGVATVIQELGVGVGSIGLGTYISRRHIASHNK